jgi:hypothetical protein
MANETKSDADIEKSAIARARKTGNMVQVVDQDGKFVAQARKVGELATPTRDMSYVIGCTPTYSAFSKRDYQNVLSLIARAREFYLKDSLVRKVIDLKAQFASTEIQLQGNQKHAQFFRDWMNIVSMEGSVSKWILKEYFLSGNVHTVRSRLPFKGDYSVGSKLRVGEKGFYASEAVATKRGEFEILDFAALGKNQDTEYGKTLLDLSKQLRTDVKSVRELAAAKLNWTNKMIPTMYTVLDPLQIRKTGASEFGLEEVWWNPPPELVRVLKDSKSPAVKLVMMAIPPLLRTQLLETGKNVQLLSDYYSAIYRMKQPYEAYALPQMSSIFESLLRKEKMRQADEQVVTAVINKILLIRVGDKDFPAKQAQLKAVSQIIGQDASVLKLVWNHAIDIKWVETDVAFINKEKYGPIDRDIKEGFGISPVLLGNTVDGSPNEYVSLRGLIEDLQDGQESLEHWLTKEFELVGEAMQFDSIPAPKCTTINLEDKVQLYKIYQGMVDRGVLSARTTCESLGEDYDKELEQIEDESELRAEGVLPTMGSPYQKGAGSPSTVTPGEGDELDEEELDEPLPALNTPATPAGNMSPGEVRGSSGRPPGTSTKMPGRKPRTTRNAAAQKGVTPITKVSPPKAVSVDEAVRTLYDRFLAETGDTKAALSQVAGAIPSLPIKDLATCDLHTVAINVDITSGRTKKILLQFREQVKLRQQAARVSGAPFELQDQLKFLAELWQSVDR